jgi:Ca2+-binding EF-hand superfamily protein
MNRTVFAMVFGLCVCAWASAQADSRSWGDSTLPQQLAIYDVDGDGVLSVEEIQAMEAARKTRHDEWVAGWDMNGDGVIDETEQAAAQGVMRDQIEATRTNRFHEADSDADGCLTFEEFSAIPAVIEMAESQPDEPARIYGQLDANDDNCVDMEEFTARLREERVNWRTEATYTAADTNADLCLSVEEFLAISNVVEIAKRDPQEPLRLYGRLDADHDGCLTVAEFTADMHLGDQRDEWRTADAYTAADTNADRCLTFEEFSAIGRVVEIAQRDPEEPNRLYIRLDVNHDRCLSLEEFTAELPREGDGRPEDGHDGGPDDGRDDRPEDGPGPGPAPR